MILWYFNFVLFICSDATILTKYDLDLKERQFDDYVIKKDSKNYFTTKSTIKPTEQININKTINLTENQRTLRNKNDVEIVVKHLLTLGTFKILAKVKFIKKTLHPTENITKLAETAIQNYSSLLIRLFDKIPKDSYQNDIEKKFIILNLVVTANEIVYNIYREILLEIFNKAITNKHVDRKKITILKKNLKEELYNNFMDDKKEYMEYVCNHFDICRMYPAYSDYIADVINEILKLRVARFNYFVTNLIILIKEQVNFFEEFLGEKLVMKISDKLETINGDISKTHKLFLTLKKMFIGKHKLVPLDNKKNKTILKAVGILIDIVDKAFYNSEDDILVIYIDNTIKSIRDWSVIGEEGISRLMGDFIRHFVNTLKYNWKPYVRKEVKTLVDIIIRGKTANKDVYKYLTSEGSKYVNLKPESENDL